MNVVEHPSAGWWMGTAVAAQYTGCSWFTRVTASRQAWPRYRRCGLTASQWADAIVGEIRMLDATSKS